MVIAGVGGGEIAYVAKTSRRIVAITGIRGWKEQSLGRINLGSIEILRVVFGIASSLCDEVVEIKTGGIEASARTRRTGAIGYPAAGPSDFGRG